MYSAGNTPKGRFPHSDTPGSKPARGSPRLFAACHVLHRLLAPRHPPNALLMLKHGNNTDQPESRTRHPPTMHRTNQRPARPRTFAHEPAGTVARTRSTPLLSTLKTPLNPAAPSTRGRHGPQREPIKPGQTNSRANDATDKPHRHPGQNPVKDRTPTRRQPSRPARPGAHQNLIHTVTKTTRTRCTAANPAKPAAIRTRTPNPNHNRPKRSPPHPAVVEADGIEPTTPCLQSRCSPS